MRKLAVYLVITILCSGFTLSSAMARGNSQENQDTKYNTKHSSGPSSKITWGKSKSYDRNKSRAPYKSSRRKQDSGKNYKAWRPTNHGYGKKYYRKHYYKPRYLHISPYHGSRHFGYYTYRGFYWPFINVRFVINLSDRQVERHHRAIYKALDARVGKVVRWHDNGRRGTIVVLNKGFDSNGQLCKKYRQTIKYRGFIKSQVVVSCLTWDGYWVNI
jgi:hypothetical protein